MTSMTALTSGRYRRGEMHEFQASDQPFVYLVSAGAIFALDEGAHQPRASRQHGPVAGGPALIRRPPRPARPGS